MCNPVKEMPVSQSATKRGAGEGLQLLGVDTCGAFGSVALALWAEEHLEWLGQQEFAGRTYSATLVSSIAELLTASGTGLNRVDAIVVVNGPGSFTGVRVGLSVVKGLAEPAQIPVVPVSRLAVLAAKVGVASAVLDAHRHEVFLRVIEKNTGVRELLAGHEELAGIAPGPGPIAVCEETAELLLKQAWPGAELMRTRPPTAADAIEHSLGRVQERDFANLALLDGHYLRRSDAEIFGDLPSRRSGLTGKAIQTRSMREDDLDRVMQIASSTHHAPNWNRQAYENALDTAWQPRRVAMVAVDVKSKALVGFAVASLIALEAELETIVTSALLQRRGVARDLFSSLKNELQRLGARDVILEVRAGNDAAQSFYRFLGFVEKGRRPAYYADPVEDAILMRLPIP